MFQSFPWAATAIAPMLLAAGTVVQASAPAGSLLADLFRSRSRVGTHPPRLFQGSLKSRSPHKWTATVFQQKVSITDNGTFLGASRLFDVAAGHTVDILQERAFYSEETNSEAGSLLLEREDGKVAAVLAWVPDPIDLASRILRVVEYRIPGRGSVRNPEGLDLEPGGPVQYEGSGILLAGQQPQAGTRELKESNRQPKTEEKGKAGLAPRNPAPTQVATNPSGGLTKAQRAKQKRHAHKAATRENKRKKREAETEATRKAAVEARLKTEAETLARPVLSAILSLANAHPKATLSLLPYVTRPTEDAFQVTLRLYGPDGETEERVYDSGHPGFSSLDLAPGGRMTLEIRSGRPLQARARFRVRTSQPAGGFEDWNGCLYVHANLLGGAQAGRRVHLGFDTEAADLEDRVEARRIEGKEEGPAAVYELHPQSRTREQREQALQEAPEA